MKQRVSTRYAVMVASGRIERDPRQEEIVARMDGLAARLAERELGRKGSALGWLFTRKPPEPLRGLYIWGSVGRGKTMLMDLFFGAIATPAKRRAHFHAFMGDVHERIHAWRQRAKAGLEKGSDPVAPVAAALAAEASVLCFDEFAVTDIADAMLLGRLFEKLFAAGVTIVATSNREPSELYKDGLNRALFLPFIAMLEERLEVLRLDARTDYRLEKLGGTRVYITPADAASDNELAAIFARMTGGAEAAPAILAVKGRQVTLPKAAQGVAMARFDDLCEQPLGAADYLAIAQAFHTVLLAGVPVLNPEKRNAAKRFITLIDVFYDNNVKTVIAADAPAPDLYVGATGAVAFEFDRTVSRLIEMASQDYLAQPHGRNTASASGNTDGLVET